MIVYELNRFGKAPITPKTFHFFVHPIREYERDFVTDLFQCKVKPSKRTFQVKFL